MTISETDIHNSFIIFKVAGILSMIGSSFIIRDIFRRRRSLARGNNGRSSRSSRNLSSGSIPLTTSILCELSTSDFFGSLFWVVVGSWMVPNGSEMHSASGTDASCTAQGFLLHFFCSWSLFCNTSLAIAYCLTVKRGWTDVTIQKRKTFPFLVLPPVISLIISSLPLPYNAYNYKEEAQLCSIAAYPYGCDNPESTVECERGEKAASLTLLYSGIVLILNLVVIASIIILVQTVLSQERRMDRYSFNSSTNDRTLTSKTAWQGIWYNFAFAVVWWPYIVSSLVQKLSGVYPKVLFYFVSITMPLQGFFNALLYFRPRYKELREKDEGESRFKCFCHVLGLYEPFQQLKGREKEQIGERSSSNNKTVDISDRTGPPGLSGNESLKRQEEQKPECSLSSSNSVDILDRAGPTRLNNENESQTAHCHLSDKREMRKGSKSRSSFHKNPALEKVMLGADWGCDSSSE